MAIHVVYSSTKLEDPTLLCSRVTTDDIFRTNALGATAHAQYHVTCAYGVKNIYIFGIPNPYFPIHNATFMVLR